MGETALDQQQLKKGSAELLILATLEDRPRHGYDIGRQIALRSQGGSASTPPRSTRCCTGSPARGGSTAAGWRRKDSAGGATTVSLPPGRRRSRPSAGAGRSSRPRSSASLRCVMPDWRAYVRSKLPRLGVGGSREAEIVDELAQELEQCYAAAIARGASEDAAVRAAMEEVPDWTALAREIAAAEGSVAAAPER